jgi:hypothetical protein
MDRTDGTDIALPQRRRSASAALLCAAALLFGSATGVLLSAAPDSHPDPRGSNRAVDRQLEETLGIRIFPGSSLIALEGPTLELVDLERPGWEYTPAHVLVADFLVDAPITELRRYYRRLCIRDPKLLLVKKDGSPGEIVAVRHSGRHPLHPKKRWLRIVTYRLQEPPVPENARNLLQRDGE